jgi:hypothetical protein
MCLINGATKLKEAFYSGLRPAGHIPALKGPGTLWQIVNSGNVAMKWLEQHKRGASIAAIMGQSVIAMRVAEMLYAEHAHCREAPLGTDQITSSNRIWQAA